MKKESLGSLKIKYTQPEICRIGHIKKRTMGKNSYTLDNNSPSGTCGQDEGAAHEGDLPVCS